MSHHALIQRIRAEYLEMPGLRLTLAQAQRFCGVDSAVSGKGRSRRRPAQSTRVVTFVGKDQEP